MGSPTELLQAYRFVCFPLTGNVPQCILSPLTWVKGAPFFQFFPKCVYAHLFDETAGTHARLAMLPIDGESALNGGE